MELERLRPSLKHSIHIELTARRGREDFWFFLNHILKNPVLYEPLHRPLAEWLMPEAWDHDKKILMLPRGHVKSNILTVGYALWCIVRDPNIRVLIYSHKDEDAIKFGEIIGQYILTHDTFRLVYPEVHPDEDRGRRKAWSHHRKLVARKQTELTEATIEIASRNISVTGRHYDLLIADDLVTKENVASSDQIKRTQEDHELCESLLDPGAQELVLGTRYDWSDEYGRIIDTPDLAAEYDIWVQPVMTDLDVFYEFLSGSRDWSRKDDFKYLIYPSRYTLADRDYRDKKNPANSRKSLLVTYRVQGPTSFANQYFLEPFDPKSQKFKEEDIIWLDRLPEDREFSTFRLLDISSEIDNQDSYTALLTVKQDQYCNIYVTDIYWGQFNAPDIAQELVDGMKVPRDEQPYAVGHEPGPYERALKPWLDKLAYSQGVFVPMRPMPGSEHQKSKNEHIMGLEAWVKAHKIHILRTCRNAAILIEEMVKFPKFNRKDCLDALAQIPVIIFPGISLDETHEGPAKEKQTGQTFKELFDSIKPTNIIGNGRLMEEGVVSFAPGWD